MAGVSEETLHANSALTVVCKSGYKGLAGLSRADILPLICDLLISVDKVKSKSREQGGGGEGGVPKSTLEKRVGHHALPVLLGLAPE